MASEKISLKVVPGASLRHLVVARLRAEISEGRLAPGSRLVERDLCAALGVSRTVVREAIRQLEAEGYVTQIPRRGPIVATLDLDSIRAIFEIRGVLEAKAAALFVERASDEHRQAIAAIVERLADYAQGGDHVDGLALVDELHRVIRQGSGNPMFEAILAPLAGRVHMLRVQAAHSRERRAAGIAQLIRLGRALLGTDPAAAAAESEVCINEAARFAGQFHQTDTDLPD